MKNQSAPCQGVKCPKGYKVNSNCTCTKVQDDSKLVKGAVKEISKEEYNKIRGLKKGGAMKTMKTGGVVNPNAKTQAQKVAGSKGVKSGVNSKASASKVARGRVGGTSTAPKTAVPRAKYGMSMRRK